MLTLYFNTGTCSLASHIALEEAGATYTGKKITFADNQQNSPEFLAVNPKGRVPALITDQGIITETTAILPYIAQCFPAAKLMPTDPYGYAKVQEFNSYMSSTVHVAHAHRPRASRWADDPAAIASIQAKVKQNMTDCFQLIEDTMLIGPWVMGDTYSVADGYLFTITRWLQSDGVDYTIFPKVAKHQDDMLKRPAVQRALKAQE